MRKYRLDIDDSGDKDTAETYFFSRLDEFWEDLIRDSSWYMALRIDPQNSLQPYLLSKKVIETFNGIRKSTELSYGQHENIYNWEKAFMHPDLKLGEVKQFCSNCAKEVKYNPRYPKYICRDCSSRDIFSREGELVEFYNTDLSGGLKIVYKNSDGKVLREDDSKSECICLIEGKEFIAQEARFGGIVIQKSR